MLKQKRFHGARKKDEGIVTQDATCDEISRQLSSKTLQQLCPGAKTGDSKGAARLAHKCCTRYAKTVEKKQEQFLMEHRANGGFVANF